jgi:DNA-directed RNA polymerase specialized sigma subunit
MAEADPAAARLAELAEVVELITKHGENLRRRDALAVTLVDQYGLTQKEVAERAGVSTQRMSQLCLAAKASV